MDKPPGMLTMPGPAREKGSALYLVQRSLGERRLLPVHRLDGNTSGLLLFARQPGAARFLTARIRSREVRRTYLAIVHGQPHPPRGQLRGFLAKDAQAARVRAASAEEGVTAITRYEVVRRAGDYSLVRLRLETGRTHQIRAQMAEAGHPLVGDRKYGDRRPVRISGACRGRHALHAATLEFAHPGTRETMRFRSDLPPDLASFLAQAEEETHA